MRILASLLLMGGLTLAGCAETEPAEETKIRFRIMLPDDGATSYSFMDLTYSCETTSDQSAVFVKAANDSDEPMACDFPASTEIRRHRNNRSGLIART